MRYLLFCPRFFFLFGFASAALLMGCKDEAVSPDDTEEELITTVRLIFTKKNTSERRIFTWRNLGGTQDNMGAAATTRDTIKLVSNTEYALQVEVLNESESPAEEVHEEISEENEEHLLVFLPKGLDQTTYTYGDKDDSGAPLGLVGVVSTGPANSGTLQVVLRHEPDSKDSPKDLDTVGGETDFDITYVAEIK